MTFDVRPATVSPSSARSSSTICFAISAYFGFNSIPYEFRPARNAATSAEPVPAMGSRIVSPRLVKNSMNSCARVSGNFAGCTRTPFLRGGGLWMNHDFWNFNQLLESRSFNLLEGIFEIISQGRPYMFRQGDEVVYDFCQEICVAIPDGSPLLTGEAFLWGGCNPHHILS